MGVVSLEFRLLQIHPISWKILASLWHDKNKSVESSVNKLVEEQKVIPEEME